MVIKIPDDLYQEYERQSLAGGSAQTPEQLITRTLERFAPHAATPRALVLSGLNLQQIDRLFGAGSTKDPQAFLTAAHAYAGVTIGNVRLDFSPAQKAEIAHRAARTGRSPEDVVREIVGQMEVDFFHVGRAEV